MLEFTSQSTPCHIPASQELWNAPSQRVAGPLRSLAKTAMAVTTPIKGHHAAIKKVPPIGLSSRLVVILVSLVLGTLSGMKVMGVYNSNLSILGGGLQNGKIAGPKLFETPPPPPRHGKTVCAPSSCLKSGNFLRPRLQHG